ncbi:MAG: NTP transferase domain-containing protein [Oscillospiraceae bacterium]|nr:NTP transferase domain-containing protein [Oscillospiraceae bacterium]
MKAIILAGGEGTRLRAITGDLPKPMVPILGEPALAHIIRFLRRNGITEARLALRYMPRAVTDHFGDSFEGVALTYSVETERRGTAGAVRDCAVREHGTDIICELSGAEFNAVRERGTDIICELSGAEFNAVRERGTDIICELSGAEFNADFIAGGGDFLVVPGDCICDFDLTELFAFHRERESEVTIALHSVPEPTEYGLVVCAPGGRVGKFAEKPAWEGVVTDTVSTGIYVLSESVLRDIPRRGEYDFARDLFPKLLASNRSLYGFAPRGYWRDIGTPDAYYECIRDARDGRVKLGHGAPFDALSGGADVELPPAARAPLEFTRRGEITGRLGEHFLASDCLSLGLAAGAFGRVGIGFAGGGAARVVAELISCGVNASGGTSFSHDGETVSEAAFAARGLALALSIFASQRGAEVKISFIGEDGAAVSRADERRLLSPAPPTPESFGDARRVSGVGAFYVPHLAKIARGALSSDSPPDAMNIIIKGSGAAAGALREALELTGGYRLSERAGGAAEFEPSPDGTSCSARGESGTEIDHARLIAIAAAAHFELGRGALILPPDAPEIIGVLAERAGAELIRSWRGAAEWSLDGLALAAELCAFMRSRGASLDDLNAKIPRFALAEREIPVRLGRGAVMRKLSADAEAGDMLDSGLVLRPAAAGDKIIGGIGVVTPLRRDGALRVRAEADCARNAKRLCAEIARRVRAADVI